MYPPGQDAAGVIFLADDDQSHVARSTDDTMAKRKRIGLIVDASFDKTLDALALITGKTRSDLVTEAMRRFIDTELSEPAKARLEAAERQLAPGPMLNPYQPRRT